MKTVFNNNECMHVYAQQSNDQGRTNNGSVFFNGKTIYSYGHYFPMCHFIDDNTAFVNSSSYSMSTSAHQEELRGAILHYKKFYIPTQLLNVFLISNKFDKSFQDELIKHAFDSRDEHLKNATKRRKIYLKHNDVGSAIWDLKNARSIFNHFNKKPPVKLERAISELKNDVTDILATFSDVLAKAKIKNDRQNAAIQKQLLKNADKWRSNTLKPGESIRGLNKTLMRVNLERGIIETSKNANFPIVDAKLAFLLIRRMREAKCEFKKNAANIVKLGHYTIDSVDKKGNVKAACHYIEWDQIEACARELNIYP